MFSIVTISFFVLFAVVFPTSTLVYYSLPYLRGDKFTFSYLKPIAINAVFALVLSTAFLTTLYQLGTIEAFFTSIVLFVKAFPFTPSIVNYVQSSNNAHANNPVVIAVTALICSAFITTWYVAAAFPFITKLLRPEKDKCPFSSRIYLATFPVLTIIFLIALIGISMAAFTVVEKASESVKEYIQAKRDSNLLTVQGIHTANIFVYAGHATLSQTYDIRAGGRVTASDITKHLLPLFNGKQESLRIINPEASLSLSPDAADRDINDIFSPEKLSYYDVSQEIRTVQPLEKLPNGYRKLELVYRYEDIAPKIKFELYHRPNSKREYPPFEFQCVITTAKGESVQCGDTNNRVLAGSKLAVDPSTRTAVLEFLSFPYGNFNSYKLHNAKISFVFKG